MAYDKDLAGRVRTALAEQPVVDEKPMFGGLSFMVRGHMCCGVVKDDLVVRVGADGQGEALAQPGARPMDFTGRPMKSRLGSCVDGSHLARFFLSVMQGGRVQSCVRPVSAASITAGPNAIRRIGSQTKARA